MANTRAQCWGYDSSRTKTDARLGSEAARAQAATWKTFATVQVNKDGSGWIEVIRDGHPLLAFQFGPEDKPFVHPFTREVIP